jgi:hypothetical protein
MDWPWKSQTAVSKYPDLTRMLFCLWGLVQNQHDGLRQGICEVTAEKEITHNVLAEFLQGHRFYVMSWSCSVCIASGCGLHRRGSISSRNRDFSSQCLDGLWGTPSLLSNGYPELFPREESSSGVKLDDSLPSSPRSRMVELYLFFP